MTIQLTGKVMGHVDQHTPATLKATFEKAYVALKLDDGSIYTGSLDQLPAVTHTANRFIYARQLRHQSSHPRIF